MRTFAAGAFSARRESGQMAYSLVFARFPSRQLNSSGWKLRQVFRPGMNSDMHRPNNRV
jgi:hypothetical protein